MSESAAAPLERAIAAWLAHLRDLGVEGLRVSLSDVTYLPAAAARPRPSASSQLAARSRPAAPPLAAADPERRAQAESALLAVREDIGDCKRCKLCSARTHIVYGVGSSTAELMFVGEAPGHDEDVQGEPFVGRAGQLLNKIIEAIGMRREDVYIANIIKCRPPGNRLPERDEIAACEGFLFRQIEAIRPRVVVSLGGLSAQILLGTATPISRLRGLFRDYRGTLLMPTFHPAFLLRNPAKKREVWEDMQKVRDRLAEMRRGARAGGGAAAGAPGGS